MLRLIRRLMTPIVLPLVHRGNERLRHRLASAGRLLGPADWGASYGPEGDLRWADCSLPELADRFGTPLHVVHEARLSDAFRRFRGAFASRLPGVEVGYSYKTNPLPAALAILHRAGAIAEVISHFELWLALRLGVPGERIVFNGPGKTPAGLRLAVESGVRIINLDNADEADLVQRFAVEADRTQAVGVRVVTSVGWAAQFGLPIKGGAALAAFERIKKLDRLIPRGLHIHLGTGIKDVEVYATAVGEVFGFARMLRERLGVRIDFFDLGGGFGVPTVGPLTSMDERLLDAGYPARPVDVAATPPLEAHADAIARVVADRWQGEPATLFFEPGRAVSSSAQLLLLRVLAVKPGPAGSANVILDGGHNLAIPTSYEIHHLLPTVRGAAEERTHHFFGPLCHPGDVLARSICMSPLVAGDVVAMMDAGAYFIPNQMNFSNPRPAAVVVHDGEARLVREAESFEDMVARDAAVLRAK